MGVGRVGLDQVTQVCEKYLANGKSCILGINGFGEGLCYDRSAWHVADAKSVWSLRKIAESGVEFLC